MLAPGTRLATYEIIELLASGGMGEVYVAQDTRLERRIALKMLPADTARDPERIERFGREAKLVAALNHPNIVTIHSVEDDEGPGGERLHFLTMELVEGQTLDRLIRHGSLPIDRFFAIAVPLADAVGAAHQKGVTHRDLKPGNVMVTTDGRVKVLDFGLAKLAELSPHADAASAATAAAPITEEGKVLGTVAYMSPEQAEGKPVDNRSDIFSLGIILYELAAGERPFKGDTKISLMSSILKDTPTSLTDIKRELPNHLGRIVKHCLEKDPDRRFQSAQDVRNELVGLREEMDSGEQMTSGARLAVAALPAGAEAEPSDAPPRAVFDAAHVTAAPQYAEPSVAAPVGGTTSKHSADVHPPAVSAGVARSNKPALAGIGAATIVVAFGLWWIFGGAQATDPSATDAVGSPTGGVVAEDDRPSVAVLYFDNLSGDASLDWLRAGLADLLITDLSQFPDLRVVTTDRLLEILEQTGNLDARVTSASMVRAVADQADVEHVVLGSFIRAGDTFRLSARLQEPVGGETLAAETVEGIGEGSVFESIDEITDRIRARLQVPVSATAVVDRDLSDVTTSSMTAYRHYTDGVSLIGQGRYADAIPAFERAVEEDPEFAMAFAKLSIVYNNILDPENARMWAERAIEHADRLTQRERFYIEGRYYGLDAETILESIEAYENALALYPDDSASRNNVALHYAALDRFDDTIAHYEELFRRGTPFMPAYSNAAFAYMENGACDRGADLMRDFLRTEPDYHLGYRSFAGLLIACGRLDEAEAALGTYAEAVAAGAPRSAIEGLFAFQLAILREDFDEAEAAAETMTNAVSPAARLFIGPLSRALVRVYRGRYAEARAIIREALNVLPRENNEIIDVIGSWRFGAIQLEYGDIEGALEALDRARGNATSLVPELEATALIAIAQARAGRAVAARTALQQLERLGRQLPHPSARRRELRVKAEIARADGDMDEAVELLTDAIELLPPGPALAQFDEFLINAFPLATAHFESGNHVEAAGLFRAIANSGARRIYQPFMYARSFYYLGKIAEQDGDEAEAREHYRRFLDYWGNGDIDREQVAEAAAFVRGG